MALINSAFKGVNKPTCNGVGTKQAFELPDPREFDLFVCKDIVSGYVIDQDDSNKYLVFDYNGNGILHIPDNMYRGTGFIVTNVGAGAVEIVMDGLEQFRGSTTLKDPNSFMTIIKVTDTLWQGSER